MGLKILMTVFHARTPFRDISLPTLNAACFEWVGLMGVVFLDDPSKKPWIDVLVGFFHDGTPPLTMFYCRSPETGAMHLFTKSEVPYSDHSEYSATCAITGKRFHIDVYRKHKS